MNKLDLTRQKWEVTQYDPLLPDYQTPDCRSPWFAASVPGAVHYDLVTEGKLENPYSSSKAAAASHWVTDSDWLYRTEFTVPPDFLSADDSADSAANQSVFLRFKGIDTYSEIWLNGKFAGSTANAYRVYDFAVDPSLLKTNEKNILCVRVKSHARMIASKIDDTEQRLNNGRAVEGTLGKSLIRRYQRSFYAGSSLLNLGTGVLGTGIVRGVSLILYTGSYAKDCCFKTLSIVKGKESGSDKFIQAECKILLTVKSECKNVKAVISVTSPLSKIVFSAEVNLKSSEIEIPFVINDPLLWWPRFYGEPNLYSLNVKIFENERQTDEINQKAGIKTSELVTWDETLGRKTFYFKINGRRIRIHGQNHIPLDYIKSYRGKDEYFRIFEMLENQNVNLVRIWGGGVVEEDYFYDECDKRGILLFQDFYLHSNQYPDYDDEWTQEFLTESRELLTKIRVHPSLCVICGGNETREGWDCWGWKQSSDRFCGERLITQDLREISAKLCPELPYIENSPHGGINCQSPSEGEAHIWGNFYNSTKDPLFVTETCWTQESYSRPETLKKYMGLDVDEYSGKNWAAKWNETTSLGLLNRYPYSDWFESSSLKLYLRSLEIEQIRADYHALNMLRFQSPSNNGVMYWSFNKGGPLFQFGCVDYGGFPLMSYYAVKRAFAPLAVQARRDICDISVLLSNHGAEPCGIYRDIKINVFHMNKDGKILISWEREIQHKTGDFTEYTEKSTEVFRFKGLYNEIKERTGEIIYVCACVNGNLAADDMLFFCTYAEFSQVYNPLSVKIDRKGAKSQIHIDTAVPVRMIELESNQKLLFSDNYFPMIPQKSKIIEAGLLEKTADEPFILTVQIAGYEEKQEFELYPKPG